MRRGTDGLSTMFGNEPFARHDHGTPDGQHIFRRIHVTPEPGMQHVRERTGRIVADDEPRVDAEFARVARSCCSA